MPYIVKKGGSRKAMRRTRKTSKTNIQHHHMLLRMETTKYPKLEEKVKVENLIRRIILDLDMDIIGKPHLHYLETPLENKGFTGVASIQTSHVSFHFWDEPAKDWLQNKESKSLLQFDIYTCGNLTRPHLRKVVKAFSIYDPTHIDIDVMNRKHTLKMDGHYHWDNHTNTAFDRWVETL
jgi:S-adenosylmethionine/arginine decarboxylase-like enzyme